MKPPYDITPKILKLIASFSKIGEIDKSLNEPLRFNNRILKDTDRLNYFIALGKETFTRKDYMNVFNLQLENIVFLQPEVLKRCIEDKNKRYNELYENKY